VVVTGGANGMAAAVVRDLVRHGARVVSLDRDEASGKRVAEEAGAAFSPCDVADQAAVERAMAAAAACLGGLDALVHAAGIAPGGPAETIRAADWEQVFAVNARGTFLTNQAAFPLMRERGGRIVNFASSAGALGYAGKAHYAASKGAVLAWTRSVAKEWGRYGITVNALAPAISTPMYAKTRSQMTPDQVAAHDERLEQDMPIGGRLGDAEHDLAPVIRFLISEDARFITGQTIAVDGGLMMVR
jgi:NAD(P)-dependent dehydrogenase (short-subunit alcohol dehydrogenase family)